MFYKVSKLMVMALCFMVMTPETSHAGFFDKLKKLKKKVNPKNVMKAVEMGAVVASGDKKKIAELAKKEAGKRLKNSKHLAAAAGVLGTVSAASGAVGGVAGGLVPGLGDKLEKLDALTEQAQGGIAMIQDADEEEMGMNGEDYADEASEFADDVEGYADDAGEYADDAGEYTDEAGEYAEDAGEYIGKGMDIADDIDGVASSIGIDGIGDFARGFGDQAQQFTDQAGEYADGAGDYADQAGDYAGDAGDYAGEFGDNLEEGGWEALDPASMEE